MDNLPRPAAILAAVITAGLGIAWGLAEFNLITMDAKIFEPMLTVFGALTAIATVFAFSVNKSGDEKQELSNREILINTVQRNWIEGVLHDALRDAEFQLEFEGKPEKAGDAQLYVDYELPIDLVLNDGTSRENLKRTSDVLLTTFQQVDRKLLILGAPGSGKTVLLLQLAEKLLEDARKGKPIPLVFNLSSWAEKRESLTNWLIEQLGRDYGAGKKIATDLIQSDSLIYLLDGFDEVAEAHREECLTKINEFMSPTRQIVICSRIEEYQTLAQPLNTKFAVEVQTLSDEQFRDELSKRIPKAETTETIIKTLQTDDEVWQEVKKPLFINILINTYADGRPFLEHNIQGTTIKKLQLLVIEPYITQQLRNKQEVKDFDNALILRYLSWISYNLRREEKFVFYVEMLQVEWLLQESSLKFFKLLNILMITLFIGVSFGLLLGFHYGSLEGVIIGLSLGLPLGLFFELILWRASKMTRINLEVKTQLKPQNIYQIIKNGNMVILIYALLAGLIFGFISFVIADLILGLIIGLISGIGFGLMTGMIVGLIDENQIQDRSKFSQGIVDTFILGSLIGLMLGLEIGVITGLLITPFIGLYGGLTLGMIIGTESLVKHMNLRLMLERRKLVPRRFDRFLEHVIERRIMRRVGGSAIFIHRYILEYFADEWQRKYAKEFED